MNTTITFNRLFVSSESHNSCFSNEFSPGVNIISGRNTSGKSSLIQSLMFAFGVNDVRESLDEILSYQPTFRVDFTKKVGDVEESYTIVRDSKTIYVKEPSGKIISFHGIDADNSVEHTRLKDYIRDLVGFSLILEQKGELKSAPLESMFLPYYISQSVGWVYLRDSFSNLQYYKGFKDDYLDYYLGISNRFDRLEHRRLTKERDRLFAEINNLKRYSKKAEFQFSNLVDEAFGEQAEAYIENYVLKANSLEEERNKYIKLCNEFSLLQNHHKILKRTKSNIKKQNYNDVDRCPACTQVLLYSLEGLYSHYQKYNDTVELESHITSKLIDKKSKINSSKKKMRAIENEIFNDYGVLLDKNVDGVTFEQWVANKANITLYKKMQADIEYSESELESVKLSLGAMVTEQETISSRISKEEAFRKIFTEYTSQLKLKPLTDSRYLDLYKIHSFPRQGVELHKTVMAYHFALNAMIEKSKTGHRLPFLLDAILKEDIDETNLETILSFVANNLPSDTQTFFSISEHVKESSPEENAEIKPIEKVRVKDVQSSYFPTNSKLIYVGAGKSERSFFSQSLEDYQHLHEETVDMTVI
ncbi:hypothetical protein KUC3_31580 [Alteromonas sp. KC3]|uniref:hypothetical protein n=1 Tax=unclassified Alteromonas TaxID=2614992 RepID=UPI001923225B|nr:MULTISPECIES: hypothetical protein [unclassified Alteromonas]BCO20301.1 hypothetical protein KUC3_31580 [Alteromonas sp. KC3]BCO24267.1 hypothetical protein KUC14_31360 [Alteromonas sp. KC14]